MNKNLIFNLLLYFSLQLLIVSCNYKNDNQKASYAEEKITQTLKDSLRTQLMKENIVKIAYENPYGIWNPITDSIKISKLKNTILTESNRQKFFRAGYTSRLT